MGQLRINTIARLLETPRTESALIWDEYATRKLEKLFKKHDGLDPRIIVQLAGIAQDHLELQYARAWSLTAPAYFPDVFDQSPTAVANTSEELTQISDYEKCFWTSKSDLERVNILGNLLFFLTKPSEVLVRKAVAKTLNRLYDETAFGSRSEFVTRPLAAAVALSLPPTITRQKEKKAALDFIGFRFHGSLARLGTSVMSEFNVLNRKALGALLASYRIDEQEGRYARILSQGEE